MITKKQTLHVGENPVSRGRHEQQCRICSHPKRDEIEQAFIAWVSSSQIGKKYFVRRDGVYRHAHVFGLMVKRQRNVRAALERIIERAGEVDVTAAAVVAAVQAYSKSNAMGQWVERKRYQQRTAELDYRGPARCVRQVRTSALVPVRAVGAPLATRRSPHPHLLQTTAACRAAGMDDHSLNIYRFRMEREDRQDFSRHPSPREK